MRRAYPPGHVRTPWYIRGQPGVVERLCGTYPNPEELAYAPPGLARAAAVSRALPAARRLARLRGQPQDTVDIEIYQHWLEPA